MRLLRMMPGYGETLIAEGDPRSRRSASAWCASSAASWTRACGPAVPITDPGSGRREALLVTDFAEIPADAERVLFWPRAAGGARARRPA